MFMARFAGACEQGLYLNRQDFESESRSLACALSKEGLPHTFHCEFDITFHKRHSERFITPDDKNASHPFMRLINHDSS